MVIRHLVVVSLRYILNILSVNGVRKILRNERSSRTSSIHKRAGKVDSAVDLILQGDREVVLSVVFSMKRLATVDFLTRAIELTHRSAPRVANPSGYRAYFALEQQLYAIAPSISKRHFVLPRFSRSEE